MGPWPRIKLKDAIKQYSGVNIDDAPNIARDYGIRSIPSLLFFNNGSVMEQRVGGISYEEITGILDKLIEGK